MTTKTKNDPADQLLRCYKLQNTKYKKGCNNEKLNEKIRKLQKETNYKVKDNYL